MNGKTRVKGNIELQCRFEMQERALEVIARELNENMIQSLCLAKLQLGSLEKSLGNREQKKIRETGRILYNVIQHLKTVIKQAVPEEIIKSGFIWGIAKELEQKEQLHGNKVILRIKGKAPEISASDELLIFCIVQEIINDNFSSTEQLDEIIISCTQRKIGIRISKISNDSKSIKVADGVTTKLKQLNGTLDLKSGRKNFSLQINIEL